MHVSVLVCLLVVAVSVYVCVNASDPHLSPTPRKKHVQQQRNDRKGLPSTNHVNRALKPAQQRGLMANIGARATSQRNLDFNCDYRVADNCVRCATPAFAGEGVPMAFLRDSYPDCVDKSDEFDQRKCNTSLKESGCWGCLNPRYAGEGVRAQFLCDRRSDCGDSSDEYMYQCDPGCNPYWDDDCFECYSSDEGVRYAFTCDNTPHCSDNSDEYCLKDGEMQGPKYSYCDGDCQFRVIYTKVCDGKIDAWDGYDEANCFTCNDGSMIDGDYKCDNYYDCLDRTDEINCGNEDCVWADDWSDWSLCDNQCGIGRQTRTKECTCQSSGCSTDMTKEERTCYGTSCVQEQNCVSADWSDWSLCDNQCGAGKQTRTKEECECTSISDCKETKACYGTSCAQEQSGGCGTREPVAQGRIVGGVDARKGAWPWQVQLKRKDDSNIARFKCGGTLYKDKYIITAAHCFTGANNNPEIWTVHLGKLDTYGNEEIVSHVSKILRPPQDYNSETVDNDIVVLLLTDPVQSSTGDINNICLDTANTKTFDSSSNCVITGYGLKEDGGSVANRLQEAHVPYISTDKCKDYLWGSITANMICAGYPGLGGIDSCQGDSGGPLVCTAPDDGGTRWYLVGITSWGISCAEVSNPGVYTKVSQYIGWLKNPEDE